MFVGHYAVSLALKKAEPKASLGWLFIGVQFVDILFFPLVLAGIERLSVIPNYTESTHFRLDYMPYSHSLAATFIWGALFYLFFRKKGDVKRQSVALVMGLAVASHWVLDLIVHTPDLPLLGDTSMKVGFGLWHHPVATFVLEAGLLLVGLVLYLKSTWAPPGGGKYAMLVFVGFLILLNVANIFGPSAGVTERSLSLAALFMYFLFAGIAFWLDGKRVPLAKQARE